MALERRGNGWYFYRKERQGKRVVSIYGGGGELAQWAHIFDLQRQDEARVEKESKRRSFETEKQGHADIDQVIEAFSENAKALEDALYLISGYHEHSRQWRRKRNGHERKREETGNT